MVLYAYSARGVAHALSQLLPTELKHPGSLGHGPLLVRWSVDGDAAEFAMLYEQFVARFGASPVLEPA